MMYVPLFKPTATATLYVGHFYSLVCNLPNRFYMHAGYTEFISRLFSQSQNLNGHLYSINRVPHLKISGFFSHVIIVLFFEITQAHSSAVCPFQVKSCMIIQKPVSVFLWSEDINIGGPVLSVYKVLISLSKDFPAETRSLF